MSVFQQKIKKKNKAAADDLEQKVAKELYNIQENKGAISADVAKIYITAAKEVKVGEKLILKKQKKQKTTIVHHVSFVIYVYSCNYIYIVVLIRLFCDEGNFDNTYNKQSQHQSRLCLYSTIEIAPKAKVLCLIYNIILYK